jgi:hypothetical protein
MAKYLSKKNVVVNFQDPGDDADISSLLRTEYSHIAVILDLQCEGSILFLAEVSR